VDKARAWVRTMVEDGDVKALEQLIGEVLGVQKGHQLYIVDIVHKQ
jgi:hypothetical protein